MSDYPDAFYQVLVFLLFGLITAGAAISGMTCGPTHPSSDALTSS
jgi:hypothetical protein